MPHAALHTKALIIVIAVLLVLNTLCQLRGPAVHAQPTSSQYGVELVQVRWRSKQFQADFATAIIVAAKDRVLVIIVASGSDGVLSVYIYSFRCTAHLLLPVSNLLFTHHPCSRTPLQS